MTVSLEAKIAGVQPATEQPNEPISRVKIRAYLTAVTSAGSNRDGQQDQSPETTLGDRLDLLKERGAAVSSTAPATLDVVSKRLATDYLNGDLVRPEDPGSFAAREVRQGGLRAGLKAHQSIVASIRELSVILRLRQQSPLRDAAEVLLALDQRTRRAGISRPQE